MMGIIAIIGKDIILSIINEWMQDNFIDVVNFDSALTNRILRESYLSYCEKEFHCNRIKQKLQTKYMKWIDSRIFKIVSFSTKSFVLLNNGSLLSQNVPFQFKQIRKLRLTQIYCVGQIWMVLFTILEQIPSLKDLTLECRLHKLLKTTSRSCMKTALHGNLQLQQLKFKDCKDVESFPKVLEILKNYCSELESIAFEQCHGINLPEGCREHFTFFSITAGINFLWFVSNGGYTT
jgi:hypothetical protein